MTCFSALLDLPLSRWQASAVLDLLAVPAIMRRFGISAGERDTITDWIGQAGVRWGRDAAHRAQLGAGAFEQKQLALRPRPAAARRGPVRRRKR